MHFLPLALLLSTVTALPASKFNTKTNSTQQPGSTIPSRLCGVAEASPALKQAHQESREARRLAKRASPSTTQYTIPTVFHIISTADQQNTVTRSMVANQFGALQAAYASSNISFELIAVNYHVNDTWATDSADQDMKLALRQGNYSTLNIYFQTNLSSTTTTTTTASGPSSSSSSSQLLGYCTLPTNITYAPCSGCALTEFPASSYALDGCNVHAASMPAGALQSYNQGKTAVHEVGHWFGLLHTFQDNSCAAGDPGDFIDDTPQEAVSTDGCPVGKKSCPDCEGVDPIHNFMDYSTDACYEGFTPEQIDRMHDMYGSLRAGF